MIVSGFLGSGKTTSMIALSREFNALGMQSAIIANDLGAKNLVDADYTRTKDLEIAEIRGDCICYVTEDLVDHIERLAKGGAQLVMSDIPGSGIGALDHVYIKLKEEYPDQYTLLPFLCLADPERMRLVLPESEDIHLPEEMRFLLNAQLAEADVIALNKVDLLSDEERKKFVDFIKKAYPDAELFEISAKTGEGIHELAQYLMTHESLAEHKEIGYGSKEFDSAEELMCWYNRRVFLSERDGKNIDFNEFVDFLIEEIRNGLIEAKRNVPHLKLFAAGEGEDYLKSSLIGIDYDIEHDKVLQQEYYSLALIINARAVCESDTMAEIIEDALDEACTQFNVKAKTIFLECFGFFDEGRRNGGRSSRY